MLFHEIYGCYYNCVARILTKALDHTLTKADMRQIITTYAFSESFQVIEPALYDQWHLLLPDDTTPLKHTPNRPLTLLEKRWLKAISLDPRIALFEVSLDGLEDIQPLYTPEDIVYFDQYLDHDDYTDPLYIKHFRLLRSALHEQKQLLICYVTGKGQRQAIHCLPQYMEYSAKDDKFRIYVLHRGKIHAINLSRIQSIEISPYTAEIPKADLNIRKKYFIMELEDQRNALERAMLHFSHFEKQAIRLSDHHYQIKLWYEADDESELIIRVLSFGSFIKVTEPNSFVSLIKQRLIQQKSCGLS